MKKFTLLAFSLFLIAFLASCSCTPQQQKNQAKQPQVNNPLLTNINIPSQQGDAMEQARTSVNNYLNYQYSETDLTKIKRLDEDNNLYFYAADGKRYVFPNMTIFESWFGQKDIEQFTAESKEKMYESGFGGNVTLRPGTLMMTETDPKIYFITGNGEMKIFGNLTLLETLYGSAYKDMIVEIPNFYFTQYDNIGTINDPADIPMIPANITIDQDKGLK